MARDRRNVFINVPFDDEYAPLFDALVFTITICGYRVRCALEEDDSGNIRLDKLIKLVRESPTSIHDLSRVELNKDAVAALQAVWPLPEREARLETTRAIAYASSHHTEWFWRGCRPGP